MLFELFPLQRAVKQYLIGIRDKRYNVYFPLFTNCLEQNGLTLCCSRRILISYTTCRHLDDPVLELTTSSHNQQMWEYTTDNKSHTCGRSLHSNPPVMTTCITRAMNEWKASTDKKVMRFKKNGGEASGFTCLS